MYLNQDYFSVARFRNLETPHVCHNQTFLYNAVFVACSLGCKILYSLGLFSTQKNLFIATFFFLLKAEKLTHSTHSPSYSTSALKVPIGK